MGGYLQNNRWAEHSIRRVRGPFLEIFSNSGRAAQNEVVLTQSTEIDYIAYGVNKVNAQDVCE